MLADAEQMAESFDPSSMILDQANRLLESRVTPEGLRALLDRPGSFDADLWREVQEQGWIQAPLEEDLGGFGLGWKLAADLVRLCGRQTASVPLVPAWVGAIALATRGPEGVASEIASGERVCALALERIADGDNLPVLEGGKLSGEIQHAAFGAVANVLLLAVRSGGAAALAYVDLSASGVTRQAVPIVDNARAAARMKFDGAEAVLAGDEVALLKARLLAATLTAFEQIGGAERCLELACDYARERKAFGQQIGAFQAVKHKLADFYTAIEMARGCASAALEDVGSGSDRLRMTAAAARLAATDAYEFAAVETIQVFGAIGVTWEAPAHHYYTRSRALAVELGARADWRDSLVSALTAQNGDPSITGAAGDEPDSYRAKARAWLAQNAPAYEIKPGMTVDERLALGRKWQALKAANGYSSITLGKQYGGGGGSDLDRIAFAEEELAYDLPTVFYGVSLNMSVPTFAIFGSEEAKAELLPKAITGEEIWCQLFSEPGAGSDLAGLRLSAKRDGDGWRLNGQKVWTSWAQFSDWGYIATRTDPSVPKHKGLTCFYVDMKAPGVEVRPIRRLGGDQEINEVFFDNVYVPDSQRLGDVNGGFKVMLATLMIERYALNDPFAGGPKLWQFIRLAQECRIGGRPAIEDGEVRQVVANCFAEWLGQEAIHTRAMAIMASGAEPGPEGSIRKLLAAKSRQRLATVAMDLKGAVALVLDESANERGDFTHSWLDAPQLRIAGGTDDILRNTIAEKILGLPQDYRPDKGVPFNAL